MVFVVIESTFNSSSVHINLDLTPTIAGLRDKVGHALKLESGSFYLLSNGRILGESSMIQNITHDTTIHVVPRLIGGKGGFGSMLRAIGAQIEKTTNREACRDLSGRRLRDINEEQRLKRWYAKQKQREEEKAELKKKKLEKLRQICEGPALPLMDDKEYNRVRAEMSDAVHEAVEKGFELPTSSSKIETSTSSLSTIDVDNGKDLHAKDAVGGSKPDAAKRVNSANNKIVKPTLKRTILDDDLDSDVSSSDSDNETDERASKRLKI